MSYYLLFVSHNMCCLYKYLGLRDPANGMCGPEALKQVMDGLVQHVAFPTAMGIGLRNLPGRDDIDQGTGYHRVRYAQEIIDPLLFDIP
jgi:hypothetical protein